MTDLEKRARESTRYFVRDCAAPPQPAQICYEWDRMGEAARQRVMDSLK